MQSPSYSESRRGDSSAQCSEAALPTVAEQMQNWLQSSAYQELRNVICDYHEGILTLRGCVSSFYLKQMAQTLVARHQAVVECVNNIEVRAARGLRAPG